MTAQLPPRAARALLEWLLSPGDAASVAGDLEEEYIRYVRPQRGRLAADLWYWRQVLLSIPRLARRPALARGLGGDVRHAARVLRRRPVFALAAAGTLGLTIALGTGVFSVVRAVLLVPLPYASPDRIVRPIPDELFFVDALEARAFADRMTTLQSTAAWSRTLFLLSGDDVVEEVRGAAVSWNHFDMLGARPLLGRGFHREDAERGDAVVLSHGLWVRRFGADPGVVGSTVEISGRATTVVGVMGPRYVPLEYDWEAWSPMPLDPEAMLGRGMVVDGRLRDGVTLEQAEEEMRQVLGDIWTESGGEVSDVDRAGMRMVPIRTWLLGEVDGILRVLSAGVAFLLLLACANVANLLLAHGRARGLEFAVRSALGGSRARVGRQIAVEVLLLAVAGGALGVALTASTLGWLTGRLPPDLPRVSQVGMTAGVAAFAAATVLVTAFVTGLAPLLSATGAAFRRHLSGGRGSSAGRRHVRVRSGLVVAEAALAVLLLAGAGLMVRTVAALHAVDPGFDAEGVVTLRLSPPSDRYPAGPELEGYYGQITAELSRLPGVTAVGAIQFLPMTPGGWWSTYRIESSVGDDPGEDRYTAMRVVRGGYFEAMRVRIVRGRSLAEDDFAEGAPIRVLVNERVAAEAGAELLGRTILLGQDRTPAEVVGIVADVRQSDLRQASHAEIYVPFSHVPWRRMHMVMRVGGDASAALGAARGAVVAVDPTVSVTGPMLMTDVVGRTTARTRLVATLLSLFGLVGLMLGGIGIYGVAAQAVGERRREIGIRLALGAESGPVALRTIREGLTPVVLGLLLGLAATYAGRGLLADLVFGVGAADVATLGSAPLVLLTVALAALTVPALRAARIDPARSLRDE